MMIAEELNVEWSKVQAVFADPNRHLRNNNEYKVMSTHGSMLVRLQHPHIMQAGASARERLKEAAAQAWGVDAVGSRSETRHAQRGQAFGDLRRIRNSRRKDHAATGACDQEPDQWWLLGNSMQRLDIAAEGRRQCSVRDRHAPARHGVRSGQVLPGDRGN